MRHSAKALPRSTLRELLLIVFLMIVATAVRLDFMRGVQWSIDADEAIVGLMGKHILEGRGIPTFYYGQHYMGSLEAILASVSFALFGISNFSLQLVPLLSAVALVPIMHRLGSVLGGLQAGRVAALLMALPPAGLIIWSSKARGGFIEILVLGALALLLTTRWLQGSVTRRSYPVLLGIILGLGWWVNNQIVYFIIPVAIFSALCLARELLTGALSVASTARIVAYGTAAFLIGSAPFWLYNLKHDFRSFGMFGLADGDEIAKHSAGLFAVALPILFGAVRFWSVEGIFPGAVTGAYLIYGVVFFVVIIARWRQILSLFVGQVDRSAPVELTLLVIPVSCIIFTISSYGWLVQAPRYLLPIYVSLFAISGVAVAYSARWSRGLAALLLAGLISLNVTSAYSGGRAVGGEPIVFAGERVACDHTQLITTLDKLGINFVRTNYWIGYRLAFETKERITFSMFQEPYQVRIPEYESNLKPEQREIVPLVLVPAQAKLVRQAFRVGQVSFSEIEASGYVIIYNLKLSSTPEQGTEPSVIISSDHIASVKASGPQRAEQAIDGNFTTRWGSGAPQRPGMFYQLTLTTPLVVQGIGYDIGMWPHDGPRGLKIELLLPDGTRESVLPPEDYAALSYLYQINRAFKFRFPARVISGVILTQTGQDARMDWSIGELQLFASPSTAQQ